MNFKHLLTLVYIFSTSLLAMSQNDPKWDNTQNKVWPEVFEKITIPSSLDKELQNAYFYNAEHSFPRPLIVSLHTWSGNYEQEDPLSWICVEKGYNYIHPDFRGPNKRPEACGSSLVISDINDAIDYAVKNANVDTTDIHIIGVSGGGHATLMSYMKLNRQIKSFSAWVPVTDLTAWFHESKGRKNNYSKDISQVTTGKMVSGNSYTFNKHEAKIRSPLFLKTPLDLRTNSRLYLFAGIHDGYNGSVPITHTILFYNKVVSDFDGPASSNLIPENDIINLLTQRNYYGKATGTLGNRTVHYKKQLNKTIEITLFEGNHEMLTDVALSHIESKNILLIGDSNGAFDYGWSNQLEKLNPNDYFYNTSVAGNTIGFNNLNKQELNSLKNLDNYLSGASFKLGSLDAIVIMLGTNDTKSVFADSIKKVPENLKKLICEIKSNKAFNPNTHIIIVSPPPIGKKAYSSEKYKNSHKRIKYLNKQFEKVAHKQGCVYVDIYPELITAVEYLTTDGIHFTPEGQALIARIINAKMSENFDNNL